MEQRPLGNSGLSVSVISFGAWQLGDHAYWGPDAAADADRAVQTAVDGGITLFDTAEGYGAGESERVLGKALGARRKDILIASKVLPKNCAPADLRASCEASLKALGTDYIDLYQIHWRFSDEPFMDNRGEIVPGVATFAEAHAEMLRLKQEGKIRAIGVSNFGETDLAAWLACGECVSDQIGYNILFRAPEYDVIPACRREGVGVLAYMPLMQGLLAGRYESVEEIPQNRRRSRHFSRDREGTRHGERGCEELIMYTLHELQEFAKAIKHPLARVAIAWLAAQPGVTSVIAGARKPEHIAEAITAAHLQLHPAHIARLNEVTAPLKRRLGRNADMWQNAVDSRVR